MLVVRGVCGWIRAAELAGSGGWGPPAGQRGCWAHRPVRPPLSITTAPAGGARAVGAPHVSG
jgi:hypothetical protein